jgi:SAM-dependent methyltransferase
VAIGSAKTDENSKLLAAMRLNTLVFWYRNHLSWRRTFCSGPEVVQKDTVAFQSREIRPLRSYLYDYLYHRKLGYFSRGPIHYVSDPIPFNVLLGESSYRKALLSEYEKAKGFLTPVEIFKPHYGNAIARYILTKLKEQKLTPSQTTPLHILEIGSGTGTALHNILSYFKEKAPSVFENVHCTSLELSEAQIERQLEVLSQFKHKVTIKATDVLQYKERNEQHGYILSLEVLDNFPHDKIKFVDGRLLETVVDIDCILSYYHSRDYRLLSSLFVQILSSG